MENIVKMYELRLKVIKPQNVNANKKSDLKNIVIVLEIFEKPKELDEVISLFIKKFSDSGSVESQLQLIKSTYVPEKLNDTRRLYLELFCKIYFEIPWKSHPVKNCLAKLLDHESAFHKEIQTYLWCEIEWTRNYYLISRYNFNTTTSEWRDVIGKLGALLENFKCGVNAFHTSIECILEIFKYTLYRQYIRSLRQPNVSPATKSELCSSIHHLIKIVIHAIQLFSDTIEWDRNIEETIWSVNMILDIDDIPIDTKANAGIVIVAYCKGKNEDPFERLQKTFCTYNLCIIFGIITHLNVKYLEKYPNALEKVLENLKPAMTSATHDSSLSLFIARAVAQLSKRLESLKSNEEVTEICLEYAIRCLDDDLDAVKNTSKEIIENLVSVGMKNNKKTLEKLFDLINNTENTNKRHKSVIIACISGAKFVCDRIPHVQKLLIDSLEDTKNHNTNSESVVCYEKLMTSRLSHGIDHDVFYEEFIKVILHKLNETKAFDTRKSLIKLLHWAIKKCSYIVDLLLKENLPIELRLSCLGAAKKSGMFNNRVSNEEQWKSILSFNEIRDAMVSSDDQVRMTAIELVVEVHRLTEMFTKEEFDCVLYFLEHNINSEIPAIRSQIIGFTRNTMSRIENGLNFFNRNPSDERIDYYKKFCHNLASFCYTNFFPGANFGRRTVSLKILLQLFESLKDSSSELIDEIWSCERFDIILNLCNDTYESNKADAVNLLRYCPRKFMHLNDVNLTSVEKMIQSCKPMRSLSGAYYLEFLVFVYNNENVFETKTESKVLNAVLWLENLLLKSYEIAKTSLMKASYQCPMYGELFALRYLLSKVNLTTEDLCRNDWKSFFERFIIFCHKLTEVAAPIVNNSSPEGHLPNDFSSMENYAMSVDKEILSNVTPQMVLLCAWRTVKEVSLLLGDISNKMPLIHENSFGYISVSQVLNIGTHFTNLLSETKHRGAFEQAYVGFTRLCDRLWSCDILELHTLPMRWLKALINIISGEDDTSEGLDMSVEKLCATRRSAGVPFLIQALVTSELQVGTSTSLKFCMENLLKIAEKSSISESRTHALNILRALFRCSELCQFVGQFISDGFILAIKSYDAETWAERNSATLLFSALMLRVFGVQREKDTTQLNIRNKMTGKTFFQRYPELFDFIYNILVESQWISRKGKRCRKLHSLLLLLERLYPSSWEEIESNLSLTEFVPLISGCTANPELKTRQLAAKIIPIIVQPDKVLSHVSFLLDKVLYEKKEKKIKVNSYHGTLLQILYLVRSLDTGKVSHDEQRFKLSQKMIKIQTNLEFLHISHIPVIVSTFCDILLEIFLRLGVTEIEFKDSLTYIIEEILRENYDVPGLGHDIMMRKYGIYHFFIHFSSHEINVGEYFTKLFELNYGYDFVESILNMLILVTTNPMDLQELEITALENSIAEEILKRWEDNQKNIIMTLQNNKKLCDFLIKTIQDNFYHQCTWKAYLLISKSKTYIRRFMTHNNIQEYPSFITLAESHTGLTREAIYACLGKCFNDFSINSVNLEFLTELITPDNSDGMKRIGIEILKQIFEKMDWICAIDVSLMSYSFWCLFTLLRDDESEIRYETAELVLDMYNKFYGKHENRNVLASIATEKLFTLLRSVLTHNSYTIGQAIIVYMNILRLDKEMLEDAYETSAVIDDASRCFDKNDTNLFGENKFVQDECQKAIDELK